MKKTTTNILHTTLLCLAMFLLAAPSSALNITVGGVKNWGEELELAELVSDTQTTEANFLIPLGKNQKVDGRWLLPHSQQFDGVIYRTLYRFESGSNLSKLASSFTHSLEEKGVTIKYECKSRSCGSSNFWANDYFFERLLYGADKHQHLWVYQHKKHWYISYLMQRGNGRVYFQELKMGLEGSTADTFSLGNRCSVKENSSALFEFIQGATVLTDTKNSSGESAPTVRLLLTVSTASDNAWQDAHAYAGSCAVRIQNAFNITLFDSLGLGSINFRFNQRVTETEYTLHRFQP